MVANMDTRDIEQPPGTTESSPDTSGPSPSSPSVPSAPVWAPGGNQNDAGTASLSPEVAAASAWAPGPVAPEVPAEPPAAGPTGGAPAARAMPTAALIALAVIVALVAGAIAGVGGAFVAYQLLPAKTQSGGKITLVGSSTEEVVAAAAEVAVPSVVNIDVTGSSTSRDGLPPGHPDTLVQGEGSGVAYKKTPDGGTYIITNNHVVEDATTIVVTDSTGERYEAELIGGDAETDIAVVKVDAEIPPIGIGDSEKLVVGQLAIAIGSPFGLQHSVTAGVISALHRPLTGINAQAGRYPYVDSIQTDAAINPGNSGGALVDRDGLLIGIPSAIMTGTGSYDGVGLAIPVRTATSAADQLIEKGRVDTPYLGILGQTVTPQLAKEESLPVDEGAWVVEVTPGTEAEKAGIKKGDVIVALDDVRIRTMDDLVLAVRRRSVGDTVTLTLWRDGTKTEVEMKVGVKP